MENKEGSDNGFKSEQETNHEFILGQGSQQLERVLKSRHIQFLALGKIIRHHTHRAVIDKMQVEQSVQVSSSDRELFFQNVALLRFSWATSQ